MRISTSRFRLLACAAVAAVAGSIFAQAARGDSTSRAIPQVERDRLARSLDRARAAIPAPPKPLAIVKDDTRRSIAKEADWDEVAKQWAAPGEAALEEVFEAPDSGTDTTATAPLELRVWINREASVPNALQSVGGSPAIVPHEGAFAVKVSTIAASDDQRMIPQTPEQAANALTVIRLYVGPDSLEAFLRGAVERGSEASWTPPPGGKPGDARWIVIEIYGGKRAVEDLAGRVKTSKLRALLSR